MPPSNRRIVTLRDLDRGSSSADGGVPPTMEPHIPPSTNAFPLAPSPSTLPTPFCQPVKKTTTTTTASSRTIPLYHIHSLPLADTCRQILERIWIEFGPIIQRRGYRVTSLSEFCCCGDGIDEAPGNRRKRPKQGDTIWGYNQTTFWKRRGGAAASSKSSSSSTGNTQHTIHLRLRQPKHHTTQLLSWEFVAGTMAHELSHCIHQNHGPAFYQLMEEILDEHATLQLEQMGDLVYGKPPPAAAASMSTPWAPTVPIPSSLAGQRLGGDPANTKSRLLQNPVVLRPLTPQARREAMAHAAERRQRQMQQIRRIIERSKEPCVIEILDDDDDVHDHDGSVNAGHETRTRTTTTKKKRSEITELVDLTGVAMTPRMATTATSGETIDLTASLDDRNIHQLAGDDGEWACHRCTVLNRPLSLSCDVCLEERDRTAASTTKKTKVYGAIIELD